MSEIICIVCPRGCRLKIDENLNVSGNLCKRGVIYGKNEVTNPLRTITSTVKITSKIIKRLPVVTDKPIPKSRIFDVMKEINKVEVSAPVYLHDVIIKNILSLGVNIIATRAIEK